MKKNIISNIVAVIFIFFITYFVVDIIVDKVNSNNSEEPSTSITDPSYGDSTTPQQPQKTVYTVVYNANGEGVTGAMETQGFELHEEKALLANTFERVGYTFEGWSTTETGRVEYNNEQIVKNLTEHPIKVDLYAVWTANTYTISFDANTGSGSMEDLSMTYDVEKPLPLNDFEKEGYTFIGWNDKADGSGTSYTNNQVVNNLLPSGNITLYAIWQVNEYKVIFNANNGTDNFTEQQFTYEQETALLTNEFTKVGYTFEGWSTTNSGRVEYTDAQLVQGLLTGNEETLNLYAVWTANTYTISFDANTGSGSMEDLSMTYDSEKILPTNEFVKEGYTFVGWNDKADGSGTLYSNNQSVNNLLETGSLTLYAQWEEHTYTVVFNSNDGTNLVEQQEFTYSEEKALTINSYSKTGYTFLGWSTTSAGRKEFEDGQKVGKLTAEDEAVINLYAVWQANTYKVEFDGNGAQGTMDEQTFTYDVAANLTANTFARTGYTFLGWNTSSNGEGTSYADKVSMNNVLTSGSLTLYAQWLEHTYTVVLDANNGSEQTTSNVVTYEQDVTLANEFERAGYTFKGWSTTSTGAVIHAENAVVEHLTATDKATVTLYAVWKAHTYTIEFDANGAEGEMADVDRVYDDGKAVPACGFTRVGYTFAGWTLDGEEVAVGSTANLTSVDNATITLVAQWAQHSYTLVLNANNGSEETTSATVTYEQDVTLANPFTRTGYTFKGWSTTSTGAVVHAENAVVEHLTAQDKATVTLYAVWKVHTYTIEFNANGAEGEMADVDRVYDDGKAVPANGFTRVGYTFTGWTLDGEEVAVGSTANLTSVDEVRLTLVAQWNINSYSLTIYYNSNNSDLIKDETISYEYKATVTKPDTAEKVEAQPDFDRWMTYDAVNGNTEFSFEGYKMPAELVIVYATYKDQSTVTFETNGGTNIAPLQGYEGDVINRPALDPTKTGYTFTNWYSDSALTTEFDFGNTTMPEGVLVIYAGWRAHTYTVEFDSNGGEGEMADVDRVYDDNKAVPACGFTRVGYTFTGWTLEGEEVAVGSTANLTSVDKVRLTLVAQWTEHTYTVVFNVNQTTYNQEFTYSETKALTENLLTKTGYTFAGWSLTEGGTVDYADKVTVGQLTAEDKAVINLYEVWTAHTYKVEFDANGAEGEMADVDRVYDDNKAVPACGFTRVGYTFAGWTLEGEEVAVGSTANLTSVDNATITLVAQWAQHSYTLVLNANNGSDETTSAIVTYEQDVTLANEFTRTGYTFKGWSTTSTGAVEHAENAVVEHLTTTDKATVTLYAIWQANTYKVEFNGNGAQGTMDEQTFTYDVVANLTANTFARTGYTFLGWNTSSNGEGTSYADKAAMNNVLTSGSLTLYAQWLEHTYTVVFYSGQTVIAEQSFKYTDNKALTAKDEAIIKVGYDFVGWATSKSGSKVYDDETTVGQLTAENGIEFNLYAVWVAHEYKVVYHSNDLLTTGTMLDQTFTYDEEKALLANEFKKEGYTFIGWATKENSNIVVYTDQKIVKELTTDQNGIINLYAVWEENTYTLELFANNGTTSSTRQVVKYSESITLTNNYIRHGYDFVGWALTPNEDKLHDENAIVSKLTSINNATVCLYAKWAAHEYTVVFHANDAFATGTMANQEFIFDVAQELSENKFVKIGYSFMGWALEENGSIAYTDKKVVKELTTDQDGIINLYAVWEENSYTLELHANDGTSKSHIETLKYGDTYILENLFMRVGYTFSGWSTTENGEVEFEEDEEISKLAESGVVHLYAIWIEIDRKDVIFTINNSIEEIKLEKKSNTIFFAQDTLLDGEVTFTVINYISDRMYQFETTVNQKGYYDVTFNLSALTVECVYTFEHIDVGEYDETPDSVEGVDVSDLSQLKNLFDSIDSKYTIETQTFFNPAALRIINKIYETDYKQDNINSITVEQDNETTFTLFDVDSSYVDTYGPTTVKYSASYSVDYEGWTRIGENKYKCDRTEVVDHFRQLLTPGLSNEGTYMTYKYVTVQINEDGSLTIRLYCSTTQSGKVIKEHKDQVNNPQWYMLLAEGTITDFE